MRIGCPYCGIKGNIKQQAIAENGLSVECPSCKKSFYVNRNGNTLVCSNCGFENLAGQDTCISCGASLSYTKQLYDNQDVLKLHSIALQELRKKRKEAGRTLISDKTKEYQEKQKSIETFRIIFHEAITDGALNNFEIEYLKSFTKKSSLDWNMMMSIVSNEGRNFLESVVNMMNQDKILSTDEREHVGNLANILRLNTDEKDNILEKYDISNRQAIEAFKAAFKKYVSDGSLTVQEITELRNFAHRKGLDWDQLMILVREDTSNFVRSLVRTASKDDIIDDREENIINKAIHVLRLDDKERGLIQYDILKAKTKALELFGKIFLDKLQNEEINDTTISYLKEAARKYGLTWEKAISSFEEEAKEFIKQLLVFARQDGTIDKGEENTIKNIAKILLVPEDFRREIYDEIRLIKKIQNIREGNLPVLQPTDEKHFFLKSSEILHFDGSCVFIKPDKKRSNIKGNLIITSNDLLFSSKERSFKFPYKSIFNIVANAESIFVDKQGQGRGEYKVKEPPILFEILLQLIRRANFLVVQKNNLEATRHIPQDVKVKVWQRDGGKCIVCGDSRYLEFDHIIPFSKGGANTVDNLQILCRNCNLKKRAHI